MRAAAYLLVVVNMVVCDALAALMGGVEGLCDDLGTLTDAMLEQARACGVDADPCGMLHDAPASLQ